MASTRTQVYLTSEQRRKLESRRRRDGVTMAAVVRDAIDAYLGAGAPLDLRETLDETFGVAPNFKIPSRDEWIQRGRRLAR